ncbi:MAG: acyl-CoA thioesterase [candidate division KSB1 bacterium]|nr:acyl-CoA thioesterase [candidate division KSB1 bacterium]MDZ7275045.1 acyl-CoA thioesterase [candidate division KSB1 bacterium]MDZ7286507.1 acyl-CoA thioesterase [candidate division KSB1 bacterium]MDZ7299329.1 acyl-CoA thioesterase [candidate division KSB1 bacterium]MDZ7307001.1 acyl-CoA thioesterase [candidate division KSB1 bacterium]
MNQSANSPQPAVAAPHHTERFRVREFVRWGDIDQAGIICYGAYVRFFEIAETEFFRAIGLPYAILFDRFDFWLPRVQLHFDFHRPALLDDLLEVEIWAGRVGRTSLRFEFCVHKVGGAITAEGYEIVVAVNRRSFHPIGLPEELLTALAPYRADLRASPVS